MFQRLILALSLSLFLIPVSSAQMRGGMGISPHFTSGFGGGRFGGRFGRAGYGYAYWGDGLLYADYPATSLAYPPSQPQVIVIQPAANNDAPPERRIDPLLIELQGDRYVRLQGETALESQGSKPSGSPHEQVAVSAVSNQAGSGELAPAVLVYRDGHREQIANYAIVSGVIYARGNYWQDGYWTKNIQLASLDIPATMKANQDSGVNFVLPSGPNVVVTRP
jgi:hypothetical protein